MEPEGRRDIVVQAVYPRLETLSARLSLLLVAGSHKNVGNDLVSKEVQADLEGRLIGEVLGAPTDDLAKERDLVRLVDLATEREDQRGALRERLSG